MNKATHLLVASATAILLASTTFAPEARADGKEVYTRFKCQTCHSVVSQGIGQTEETEAAAPDEGEASDEGTPEPKDLSNVGSTRDAAWLKDWLQKKVKIDGRKHMKRFSGTPEELDELAKWMAALKEAPEAKK